MRQARDLPLAGPLRPLWGFTSVSNAILEHSSGLSAAPLAAVLGADLQSPLIDGTAVRYVNLDYAASTPALRQVNDYVQSVLPYYASVHRGAGYASQISTSLYENARRTVRTFIGGREDDSVIFTRNTTDALNLLAGCVPEDGEVLYLDLEHHANLLPWLSRPHRGLAAADTLEATVRAVEEELAAGGINLLAVTGASNVTGEVLPIARLAAAAHAHGARIVVDAAQLAPHRRMDLVRDNIDYVAFSGHKLYAPFGAGVLVGRSDWLDSGTPHLAGGGAVRTVRLDSVSWTTGPARHEGGSPNVLGAAALAHAIEVVAALREEEWLRHEAELRNTLTAGLDGLPGVTVHRIFSDSTDAIGVVNFSVHGYDAGLVAAYLSAEHGVGLRDGKFCAHPLLKRLGLPSGSLRASFGLGSRQDDVDRLLDGLASLLRDGLRTDYVVDAGRWVPAVETRTFPEWAPHTPGTAGAAPCTTD